VDLPGSGAVHREPLYTNRRDLVADYPTYEDRKFYRLPTLYASIQKNDFSKDFPIILTSGRLVEYEGGGDETRSNPWLAELQQDMFVEINPRDANNLGVRDGEQVWVDGPEGGKVKVMAMVTERVGEGVAFMPFHFGGTSRARTSGTSTPKGPTPMCWAKHQHRPDLWLRLRDPDAGDQSHALQDRARRKGGEKMASMKFLCDAERCIECNACVTACKNEHEVPWGINRRRVVTINDGKPGERSISVACMHCSDAPCMAVCPVDCFYQTDEGVVLHSKDLCIGCGYCFYACPFGAPQYPAGGQLRHPRQDGQVHLLRRRARKKTPPPSSRSTAATVAEGKLPICAEMCSTKALLAGDGDMVSPTSTASASWPAASARAPGAGARPTSRRAADFDVILWDLATKRPIRHFQGHKGKVMAIAATADGQRLASASWDGTIRIWDVATGNLLADLDEHDGNVNDVVWSADGNRFYSASYDGTVVEWDGRKYVPLRRLASHGFGVNVLALNDEAGWIAYGALDGGTRVLDIKTGREIADLTADRRPVLALAQARDGSKIAVGDGHGFIMVVDTDTWRISRDFRAALHGPIWALDFTPSGAGVIAGGIADEAYLWPLEGGDSQPRMAEIRRQFHVDPSKVSNGERQFLRKCSICHTLGADGERRAGPPLAGLFGRPAGAVAGYNYSEVVRNSGIVWSEETINTLFDLGPDHYLPGTNMPMQRIVSEEDRADLIEFLKRETAETGSE
jgi:cytochrome c